MYLIYLFIPREIGRFSGEIVILMIIPPTAVTKGFCIPQIHLTPARDRARPPSPASDRTV